MDFEVKALDAATWVDFEDLAARHNGVWGGCWCMGFHAKPPSWQALAPGEAATPFFEAMKIIEPPRPWVFITR